MTYLGGHKKILFIFLLLTSLASSIILSQPISVSAADDYKLLDVFIDVESPVVGKNYGDFTIKIYKPSANGGTEEVPFTDNKSGTIPYEKPDNEFLAQNETFTISRAGKEEIGGGFRVSVNVNENWKVCIYKDGVKIGSCKNAVEPSPAGGHAVGKRTYDNWHAVFGVTEKEALTEKANTVGVIAVKVIIEKKMSDTEKFGPLPISLLSNEIALPTTIQTVILPGDISSTNIELPLNSKFRGLQTGIDYKACISGQSVCSDTATLKSDGTELTLTIKMTEAEYIATPKDGVDSKTSCSIPGIGWIICPVVNFMAGIADSAFVFLSDSFLNISPNFFKTSGSTYTAWNAMRSLANVAFVIAFLIIIYSQMTGFGITNYGVKKMLPRLIVAAILVNLSFFICQIAVDISNILGGSLKSFFDSLIPQAEGGGALLSSDWKSDGNVLSNIALVVLGGTLVWVSIAALIPVLLAAVVSLVMILFMLVARQALVILLIVVSPLAFVAYLLPNTNNLFKQWKKIFTSMLLLFPIVALIFGMSNLASGIIADAYSNDSTFVENSNMGQIVAAAVLVLPLFVVPVLLKKSLNSVGNIGSTLNGLSDKWGKGLGNKYTNSGMAKYQAAKKADRASRISTGNYKGMGGKFNPRNLRSNMNRGLIGMGAFNAATGGYGAYKALQSQSQDRKDSQEAVAMFGGNSLLAQTWADKGGKELSSAEEAKLGASGAAQYKLMRNAGYHNKASSFLGAAQMLSENGKGSGETVYNALNRAREHGASEIDVSGATHAALSSFKKSGRGDSYAVLSTLSNGGASTLSGGTAANPVIGGTKTITSAEGWSEVAPTAVDFGKIPDGTAPGVTAIAAGYQAHLLADPNNTYNALAGYNNMNPVTRNEVTGLLISAANTHAVAAHKPPITTIKEAKEYFAIS